jgi:excisionase family DNA binding protein
VLQGPAPTRLRVLPGGTERLLTVREVAERLTVCAATVYGLCQRGELPHVRVSNAIRFRPADVEAFLARGLR